MTNQDIHYTIIVACTDGSTGLSGQPGNPGVNSKENQTGEPGKDGTRTGRWLNKTCCCATKGQTGASGASGGTHGIAGGNGTSPSVFVLKVNTFQIPDQAKINIQSRGGHGGQGGSGGRGGDGAPGGKAGTNVVECIENGDCQPGLGGIGGAGAHGGKGGKGGDAADGGDITIYYVNDTCVNQIVPYVQSGNSGTPGDRGSGGKGGKGGQNEIFPRDSDPTFASDGITGPTTGDNGAGKTAAPGHYNLVKVHLSPPR